VAVTFACRTVFKLGRPANYYPQFRINLLSGFISWTRISRRKVSRDSQSPLWLLSSRLAQEHVPKNVCCNLLVPNYHDTQDRCPHTRRASHLPRPIPPCSHIYGPRQVASSPTPGSIALLSATRTDHSPGPVKLHQRSVPKFRQI
jgi:hypothetical protein